MPDRDYYLGKDASFDKYRAAYKTYVTKILELLGDADAGGIGRRRSSRSRRRSRSGHWAQADLRDVGKAIKPMPFADFKTFAPSVAWETFLPGVGLPATADEDRRVRRHGGS